MNILVTGGAGYIGSHMVLQLHEAGHKVVSLDNLSKGYADAVLFGELVVGDIADTDLLDDILVANNIDAVMHFAAFSEVGESVREPAKYQSNNVDKAHVLLDRLIAHGVDKFIFSSSAAVYGNPVYTPIDESHATQPINPYGESKLRFEQLLNDYTGKGIRSVSLRYFNAAGADPLCRLGERHEPETHLIPLVLQAASGRREAIHIFGNDYDTADGTCIRDYIHVSDLCDAHLLALDYLCSGQQTTAINLGNGDGFSVKQIIDIAGQVTGNSIPLIYAERREGDPAVLVADARHARDILGWSPAFSGIDDIVRHAWAWEQQLAGLY